MNTKTKHSLMTLTELGHHLGVDRRQVWTWSIRSAHNGFPAPARTVERLGRTVKVWDVRAVDRWHSGYVPAVGGRPKTRIA